MPLLPPDNLLYPARIQIGQSAGSGFYINDTNATYLATATHVLFERGIELYSATAMIASTASDFASTFVLQVNCEALLSSGQLRKHAQADVTVVKIADVEGNPRMLNFLPSVDVAQPPAAGAGLIGLPRSRLRRIADVGISNEAITFAYPGQSLGRQGQIDHGRPLLRRGMIAAKTPDNRIVLDCPTTLGNSGGLATEIEELALGQKNLWGIGIITEMVPFVEELWSKPFKVQTGVRYENSGYTIIEPMDRVLDLL